ncbi:coatomer subunit beta [Nematocida sp. AWRm80]|nr:coatomer subunit beta [Nematocida sp. AWRm80]
MSTLSRTLYISRDKQDSRSKEAVKILLVKGSESDKISCLWQIVKEMAMGVDHQDLLLTLSMTVPNTKDKRLILLFYQYMEGIEIEDSEGNLKDEILMVCNMIRMHLAHPNEHVRTKAIRIVSRFRNPSIFDALKEPFVENLKYTNPLVRAAAYIALRRLAKAIEISGIFDETLKKIPEYLLEERDAVCLAEGYKTLELIDPKEAHHLYTHLKESAHEGLRRCFLKSAEKEKDCTRIKEILESDSSRTITLEGSLSLIRLGESKETIAWAIEKIFELSNEYLDAGSKARIIAECRKVHKRGLFSFEGTGIKIAKLATPALAKVNSALAMEIFLFAMEILVIVEARELFNYLVLSFTDSCSKEGISDSLDSIFFLSCLKHMLSTYKIYTDTLVDSVLSLLPSSTPELSLIAVEYLEILLQLEKNKYQEKIVTEVINQLDKIKYGKILREVFSFISRHSTAELATKAVSLLYSALDSKETGLLPQLRTEPPKGSSKIFPGVSVVQFLLDMARFIELLSSPEEQKALRVEIVTVALKLYSIGKSANILDESSKLALLKVSALISSGSPLESQQKPEESLLTPSTDTNDLFSKTLHTRPFFSLIKESNVSEYQSKLEKFLSKNSTTSLSKLRNIFQLTSIVDPLYCECKITCSRTEIFLDILLVNQTDMLLENIEFDIVTSSNIKLVCPPIIESIRPHTAQALSTTLVMEEPDSGFIGGIITAGRMGQEDFFLQNLQEIRFNISDMLRYKSIGKEEFKDRWPFLLWENLYTTMNLSPEIPLEEIISTIVNTIKGTVIDTKTSQNNQIYNTDTESAEIIVKNIFTTTAQGADIFINAMAYKQENKSIASFRIRGEKCMLVKSFSQLISNTLKAFVQKYSTPQTLITAQTETLTAQ